MENKKIIVLTVDKRLYKAILLSVKSKGLEVETKSSYLSDIEHIGKLLKLSKNTSFLRDEYSNFIKENNGTPLAVILDYKIDFELDPTLDPDKMKLLRTFIISSVILQNIANLAYSISNFILIGHPQYLKQFKLFKENPHLIFKLVRTTNPQINAMLDKNLNNPEYTKKIFSFDYILMDESNDVITASQKLELILDELLKKKQSIMNKEKTKDQTEIITGEQEPAKIIYKLSNSRLYMDGKLFNIENNNKFEQYRENIIYIAGYYTHLTVNLVNLKLLKLILEDLPKLKNISADAKLEISINSHTVVDSGTTHALNIILTTKLSDYKNIKIITSPENFSKFEKSPGFISLRNYIMKGL